MIFDDKYGYEYYEYGDIKVITFWIQFVDFVKMCKIAGFWEL